MINLWECAVWYALKDLARYRKSNHIGKNGAQFAVYTSTGWDLFLILSLENAVIHCDNTHFWIIRHDSLYQLIGGLVCLLFIFS